MKFLDKYLLTVDKLLWVPAGTSDKGTPPDTYETFGMRGTVPARVGAEGRGHPLRFFASYANRTCDICRLFYLLRKMNSPGIRCIY